MMSSFRKTALKQQNMKLGDGDCFLAVECYRKGVPCNASLKFQMNKPVVLNQDRARYRLEILLGNLLTFC